MEWAKQGRTEVSRAGGGAQHKFLFKFSTKKRFFRFLEKQKIFQSRGRYAPHVGTPLGLGPPTFHVVSAEILSYGPKTVCQFLTDSLSPAICCQTVCVWLSAKIQPLPLREPWLQLIISLGTDGSKFSTLKLQHSFQFVFHIKSYLFHNIFQ
jgi:hypothetical protein